MLFACFVPSVLPSRFYLDVFGLPYPFVNGWVALVVCENKSNFLVCLSCYFLLVNLFSPVVLALSICFLTNSFGYFLSTNLFSRFSK